MLPCDVHLSQKSPRVTARKSGMCWSFCWLASGILQQQCQVPRATDAGLQAIICSTGCEEAAHHQTRCECALLHDDRHCAGDDVLQVGRNRPHRIPGTPTVI